MIRRLLRLAPLALAAACADAPGVLPPALPAPVPSVAAVRCTVAVGSAEMRCDSPPPAGGARRELLVGGQGTYVQLRSANLAYDSVAQVFSGDVSLQNLLGQPVGTEDGTTAAGIRVFFHVAPTASAGTGPVEVLNEDGRGIFTASDQPYFLYPDILAPYERTAPRSWRWSVPTTVQQFSFTVYVSAHVPNPQGVLRWTRDRGDVVARDLHAVWGTGPNDIWAAGDRTMMYNNGTRWVVIPGDWDGGVAAIGGSGTDDVWAVGGQLLRHFDGRRWRAVTPPVNENFTGVWASSPSNAYVTGGAFGWVVRWNGAAWDTVFQASAGRRFAGVWGAGPSDVFVAGNRWNAAAQGYDGWVWRWNGAAWDSTAIPGASLNAIWGSSASDVYVVGGAGAVHHWNGTTWNAVAAGVTSYPLYRVWGSGPANVWAVGGGSHGGGPEATVLHFDGTAWREVASGGPATARAVFAPNPDKVYVVGGRGMIQRRSGGAWGAETSATPRVVSAVAPVGDDDAFAVGCGGVTRNAGHGWQTVYATPDCLEDVWAAPGGSQLFAVGQTAEGTREGVVVRWDGAAWTRTLVPQAYELLGVWGLSATEVYATGWGYDAGQQVPRLLRWNGTAWSEVATGEPTGQLRAVWGTSPDNLYAVGTVVLHWNGTAWTRLQVHEWADDFHGVWGSGPDDVFLAGGRVARWDGTSWSSFQPRNNFTGNAVWGSGPGDVYVVGTHSLHFNGTRWTEVNIETSATLHDVAGVSARRVWAVGEGGTVMRGRR